MTPLFRLCLGAAPALLLLGCATPGQPVQQTVTVETPGCAQARCTLANDRGSWDLAGTPGAVTLTTSHTVLTVTCRAVDGTESRTGAASSLQAQGATGAVVGGAIGAGVGIAAAAPAMAFIPPLGVIIAVMGAAMGAGSGQAIDAQRRAIRYPDLVTVPMNCAQAAPSPSAPASRHASFGFSVLGLTSAQGLAAGIGERAAVLVSAVVADGAAAAAGLQPGDIVLSVRDQALDDAAAFEAQVQAVGAGQSLPLRIWRDGRSLDLVLVRPAAPL
jgi:hypothetical protein